MCLFALLVGELKSAIGPDGTRIALDTTRPSSLPPEVIEDVQNSGEFGNEDEVQEEISRRLLQNCSYASLEPIIELTTFPVGSLVAGDADWSLEVWIFLPLLGRFPSSEGDTLHTIAASQSSDALLTIQLPSGKFGMWCQTLNPYPGPTITLTPAGTTLHRARSSGFDFALPGEFLPYAPEGAHLKAIELEDLQSPGWHFVTVAAQVLREDPSDPKSEISTIARLYVDGKFGGRLKRPGLIEDIETAGNINDKSQAFGMFAALTVVPVCLSPKQVKTRYRDRLRTCQDRLKKIMNSRRPLIMSRQSQEKE